MLTNEGKRHIKRFLAGMTPSIAQSVAFGIGTTAATAADTRLAFEVGRENVSLVSYDFINDKLIFKAPVSELFGGTINEVCLYSLPANDAAGEYGSKIITTFDSDTESWIKVSGGADSTFVTTNVRVGNDGLSQTPAASATQADSIAEVQVDFSGYSSADKFVLAAHSANANASSVKALFMTDASNYYTITFGALTSGYNIVEKTKASATVTGSPDWSNITEMRVSTTAGAAAANVTFDGIRIEDADTFNPEYSLVARTVLSTPFVKVEGMTKEIEYALDVSL